MTFLNTVSYVSFLPGLLRRPSSHSALSGSTRSVFQKGSKQSVLSFRFTYVQLHSFTHCLHLLAGSQGGLCESGARSNASTVSCSRSRSGRRKAKKQSICHTFRFVHLPVSAGGRQPCSKHSFCRSRKISASRCKLVVKK